MFRFLFENVSFFSALHRFPIWEEMNSPILNVCIFFSLFLLLLCLRLFSLFFFLLNSFTFVFSSIYHLCFCLFFYYFFSCWHIAEMLFYLICKQVSYTSNVFYNHHNIYMNKISQFYFGLGSRWSHLFVSFFEYASAIFRVRDHLRDQIFLLFRNFEKRRSKNRQDLNLGCLGARASSKPQSLPSFCLFVSFTLVFCL